MNEPLLFVNIGWMKWYKGPKNDPTVGGHGWLKKHSYGHEAWNFFSHRGRLYGYVPRSARINLKRLGAARADTHVSGVTVVWIARSPRNGKTYVIGWYRDAVVYRDTNEFEISRPGGMVIKYQITAPVEASKLLAPTRRTLAVPTAKVKGNLGQSPVWYGNPDFVARVRAYLKSDGAAEPSSGEGSSIPRQSDPELRKQVEEAAIRHATDYFRSSMGTSCSVTTVERDKVGWDLTVTAEDVTLKVEVKGLTGNRLCVELTPNEYKQMQSRQHRSDYVVYVVTEALTSAATASIFYYDIAASKKRKHVWMTEDGRQLKIEPLTGARLTA